MHLVKSASHETLTDAELVARCLANDTAAQRMLFARERRRVHATLHRILGSNAHMEDLAQEAFLQIFRSLGTWRGEAKLSTWMDRCTVRVAYRFLSQKKRAPVLESVSEPASKTSSVEDRALAREATRQLYRLLDALAPNKRIAFVLHVVEGRSMAEVASVMGATQIATKVRVFRARHEIERRAKAECPALSQMLEQGDA
ncbi:MAG TPA: sigma-70 family RNA polymerase sigma factor [Polyangiaceae bacterium]